VIRLKKFKIGFCGTHGTGKTTQAYQLATDLKKGGYDASVVTEIARNCPYTINEKVTTQGQLWIFSEMLNKEVMSKSQITICDRTLLDVYAYTKRVDEKIANSLLPFIREWYKTYDIVFLLEPNKKYKLKDGIRSTNLKFQKEIAEIIEKTIEKYKLPYEEIHSAVCNELIVRNKMKVKRK
jgi:nicotinamide riboside kinase